jgi:hypothetical protein
MIHKELSGSRIRHNPLGLFFAALNDNCSAQERLTGPKLVWLELVMRTLTMFEKVSSMFVNKTEMQNI